MGTKRPTIGTNPLDSLIGGSPRTTNGDREAHAGGSNEVQQGTNKLRLTVHVPNELIDRVKNAVYWTPGETLASLAERALLREIEELERANGGPFKQRREELKGGRPLK